MSAFHIDAQIEVLQTKSLQNIPARPLIGITGNFDEGALKLLPGYFRSIEAAGGLAVVIPPCQKPNDSLIDLLDRLDGILLSGGGDLNPLWVGEDPVPALRGINPERDAFELALVRLAYDRSIPMLGICRGIQLIVASLGGTVLQDMQTSLPEKQLVKHMQDAPRGEATHWVKAEQNSLIEQLLGSEFTVNSFHHQAVDQPGRLLKATAYSADGIIEAVESNCGKEVVGVQWHPECFVTEGDDCMLPLFRNLVKKAENHRNVRNLHHSILTLDSHCDTPMFFDKGVELTRRDSQLLVDFPKMREGMLDATIMVAYLPQGVRTPEGYAKAIAQTDHLLSEIATRVEIAPNVALAASPADLYRNKQNGILSVMRGIENGYAIGHDLNRIAHYRKQGVVYITLCHNGDNDICDSACRTKHEHGGLSDFGREVVREMNRVGLMVDLSHASEASFYDAIQCSQTPIVCSHSSSRALCNHPRNLTDDQLRALAQTGGVAQVTLYHGFLRPDNEGITATLADAVRHLMHMIEIAGIDHVGIGTDFDGDGGVPGCTSASELTAFTRCLMAEGLTPDDLQKIWGTNFLRVMSLCQSLA